MRLSSLAVVLFALTMTSRVAAQLIVELPFDAGLPTREMRSRSPTETERRAPRLPPRAPAMKRAVTPVSPGPTVSLFSFPAPVASLTSGLADRSASAPPPSPPPPPPPETLVISSFDGTVASGSIRPGTTWVGQVSQGPGYITIGGTARDDNGWGATGLSLDATGMTTLTITAQRDTGHDAGSVFLQLEDRSIGTRVFAVDATRFAVGTPTQVQVVIGVWSGDFDFTQIAGWNIGGGGVGTQDFRMTFQDISLSASAIPEPSTYAVIMGAAFLGAAFWRRRPKL